MRFLFGSNIDAMLLGFRDYIKLKYGDVLSIQETQTSQGEQTKGIFVAEDSPNLAAILHEKDEFLAHPFNSKYAAASWEDGELLANHALPKTTYPWVKSGKVTSLICLLCIVVYLLQLMGFEEPIMLFAHYPAEPSEDTQLWRYVSHAFVHLSFLHLLFNVAWFWLFGGAIEQSFGSLKLLMLALVAAVISGVCQNYASGPAFFGLSGVVYAVLGYVLLIDRLKPHTFNLPAGFFSMLLVGIALGFVGPFFGIYVGNAAHISGFILGILWGFFDSRRHLSA